MIKVEQRNMLTGLMGTIAFHLIILVIFLTLKLGKVKNEHQEALLIEFTEQEYKSIEQIIEEEKPKAEITEKLSNQTLSNIASNTAEKMNEKISTEKYIEEVMKELGMEEINPQHDNTISEEEISAIKKDNKEKKKEKATTNFGKTRITYNVPGRKGKHIERPIYRCQGGGTVIVKIQVDQAGFVTNTVIESSSTSEECVIQMAIQSAKNSTFNSDYNAAKKVDGTISYTFVSQ